MYLASADGAMVKIVDPAGGQATPSSNAPNVAFSKTIAAGGTVRQSAIGADGSVFVLADVTEKTLPGQPIKGASDVALMKYDSAGNLVYARTLGASSEADGLSLAVSSDGHVAIAGSVTGSLSDNAKASTTGAAIPSSPCLTRTASSNGRCATRRAVTTSMTRLRSAPTARCMSPAGRRTAAGDWDAVFAAYYFDRNAAHHADLWRRRQ